MKKLLLSVAVASTLGLSGCGGGESIAELKQEAIDNGIINQPYSRISFDPAKSVVSVPNDLLFSGTTDGTLVMPDEKDEDGKVIADPSLIDYTSPQTALGALDGWSTSVPFALKVDMGIANATIDQTSLNQPGAVRLFEANIGGGLSQVAACKAAPPVSLCGELGTELIFGVDFVTKALDDADEKIAKIVVVPLTPLKAKQGYILVLTNKIMDSEGTAVYGSSSYETVRRDIATLPLPLEKQLGLQYLINSYENGAVAAGVDRDSIIYTAAFTTQSVDDVLTTTKLLMMQQTPIIEPFADYVDGLVLGAGDLLAQAKAIDPTTLAGQMTMAGANRATVMKTTLHTPYYLDKPDATNCILTADEPTPTVSNCASLFSRFTARGDSPITVVGALTAGVLTKEEFLKDYDAQKALFGRGDFVGSADYKNDPAGAGDPAQFVGMKFDIPVSATMEVRLDNIRHTTQWNPIVEPKNDDAKIEVLVTVPNVDYINALRGPDVNSLVEPATGWPVMIYAHGITTTKETLLAMAGAMAEAGVVVVAIDHPLHGSRGGSMMMKQGFVLPDGTVLPVDMAAPLSASDVKDADGNVVAKGQATAYLNLASLLTGRDNLRQSEIDLLALRIALNAMPLTYGTNIDLDKVSFFGHSLGGITGVTFTAVANGEIINPTTGDISPVNPYAINAASYFAPGGSIPGVLLNSGSFSSVVKEGLTASDTFQEVLIAAAATQGIDKETLAALKAQDSPVYQGLVDAVYTPFSAEFNFAAQTIIDSADQINYAQTVAEITNAIHVMEVVGDGEANLSDAVVPNNALSPTAALQLPLVGTDPLVMLMKLNKITATTGDFTAPVSGVVRFTKGHHGSILTPAVVEGVAEDAAANLLVTMEMQSQLANFIGSKGTYIKVTDADIIEK